MADGHHEGPLGDVYGAKRPEEVAALYDRWADNYDSDMSMAGYRHPTICLALLARHLPGGASPLLDAGVGTGLIGEWLSIMGYPHVEGLDLSEGMLKRAGAKNVYKALHKLALGELLPFADGQFAGVVSAGVFTTGHVGPEGLDELIRATRADGVIVLTVKTTIWDEGFKKRLDEIAAEGRIEMVEETQPYVSMPGETGTIPSLAVVLKRL